MPDFPDEAIRTLRSLYWSDRDPHGRAFAPLAEAYRKRGEWAEARTLLEDGLGRLPDFPAGHLVAARLATDEGDRERAREHLIRVLDLDSENGVALLERARLDLAEGDREGATGTLRELLLLEPGHLEAQDLLATLEIGDGTPATEGSMGEPEIVQLDDPEVSGLFDEDLLVAEAAGEEPDPLLYTRTMGDLFAAQGFPDRAIEVYEHLLQFDPEDDSLRRRIAELRLGAGERVSAPSEPISELESALEVEWAMEAEAESSLDLESPMLAEMERSGGEVEPPSEQGGRTIRESLSDLLAWVPGAVPIASLAPVPLPASGLAPAVASAPAEPFDPPAEPEPSPASSSSPVAEPDPRVSHSGADEFQSWLESLNP